MVDVAPLKPLSYSRSGGARLETLVAPPYDVIDAERRAELALRDPHNVVHIDLPIGEGAAKYEIARSLFAEWQRDGVLVRDETPAFYRYAQTFEPPNGGARATRRGFFALVRATPYDQKQVLPHERTLTGPKEDRIALCRATRAVLSPQFMLYSDPGGALDADLDSGAPVAAFRTDDGVDHQIARVDSKAAVARIVKGLSATSLLIADGHHRYETAVLLSREIDAEVRAQGRTPSPRGEHLYTFALLANGDDPNLVVFATHRLIHSLPGFAFETFLTSASAIFDVTPVTGGVDDALRALEAATRPAVSAVVGGAAALLTLREGVDLSRHPVLGKRPSVVRQTPVALLHDAIFEDLFGISKEAQAAKTNLRYVQDARKGAQDVAAGRAQVLFLLKPTEISTVRRIAEASEVMPQKSTFFYPKVPSGLFFHTLLPEREVG